MQKTEAEVLVFDEIDVGISGGTAEIVGRLLADLAQHVQILCITHQAQVAAQSDQHLLVKNARLIRPAVPLLIWKKVKLYRNLHV